MKTKVFFICILVLVLSLIIPALGCGSDNSTPTPEPTQGPYELPADGGTISFTVNPGSTYILNFSSGAAEYISGWVSCEKGITFFLEIDQENEYMGPGSDLFAYEDIMQMNYEQGIDQSTRYTFGFYHTFAQSQNVEFNWQLEYGSHKKTPTPESTEPKQGPYQLPAESGTISFVVDPGSTYILQFNSGTAKTISGWVSCEKGIDFGLEDERGSDFFWYHDITQTNFDHDFYQTYSCEFLFRNNFTQPQLVNFNWQMEQ